MWVTTRAFCCTSLVSCCDFSSKDHFRARLKSILSQVGICARRAVVSDLPNSNTRRAISSGRKWSFFGREKRTRTIELFPRLIWPTYRLFSEREIWAMCEYPKVWARGRIDAVFRHRLPSHHSSHVVLHFVAVLSESQLILKRAKTLTSQSANFAGRN